jgi:hypothetical protein
MLKAFRNAAIDNPPMQTLVRASPRSGVLPPAIYNRIWHLSSTGAKRVRDFVEEPQFANFLWSVDA